MAANISILGLISLGSRLMKYTRERVEKAFT